MLTLTRRPGEKIILTLPDGRRGTIIFDQHRYRRGWARLVFDMPADVQIMREELLEREDPKATP